MVADAAQDAAVDAAVLGGMDGASGTVCADLDGNNVRDCEESLVQNQDFDTTIAGWMVEGGVTAEWSSSDGATQTNSGAIAVTNSLVADSPSSAMAGVRQCIPMTGGATYKLMMRLYFASGQGVSSAGMNLLFYPSTECTGTLVGAYTSPLETTPDSWIVTQTMTTAPAGAQSMALRLVAVKPFRQPTFRVLFDDVLVKRQ